LHITKVGLHGIGVQYCDTEAQYCDTKVQYYDTEAQYCDIKVQYYDTEAKYCDTKVQYCDAKVQYCDAKVKLHAVEIEILSQWAVQHDWKISPAKRRAKTDRNSFQYWSSSKILFQEKESWKHPK
jgi:hypothetical protein